VWGRYGAEGQGAGASEALHGVVGWLQAAAAVKVLVVGVLLCCQTRRHDWASRVVGRCARLGKQEVKLEGALRGGGLGRHGWAGDQAWRHWRQVGDAGVHPLSLHLTLEVLLVTLQGQAAVWMAVVSRGHRTWHGASGGSGGGGRRW